ncbi:hypothetical protein MNBD_GAMMA21-1727 [hydrothermal vent metagenome]|uniref:TETRATRICOPEPTIDE REPEAT FAMILY PROTEIN n=1 Tax=hydrothermal vent metagenome TaxID=652676 RepID=A0A3B0ZTJ3_9ZZZZ
MLENLSIVKDLAFILNQIVEKNMADSDDINLASAMAAFESKQFADALRLFMPFAVEGDADAQHRIAIIYQNGLGVVKSCENAFKWMKASAEQGYAIAQHGLGFMYLEGECAEQDSIAAANWFEMAAKQDLAGSQTTLAQMYEQGNGVEQDADKAKEWYAKAGF